MNAVRRPFPADLARQELQDQLDMARADLDKYRGKDDEQYIHSLERVRALTAELGTSTWGSLTYSVNRDTREHYGSREEQRREDDSWQAI